MTDSGPDVLTAALQRLDTDLAQVASIRDEYRRAQLRAEAEQRWLTACADVFGA